MDPKEALSPEGQEKSISKLAVNFPNLIEEELDELQEQWRDLLHFSTSLGKLSKTAVRFWHEVGDIKDGNNHTKFDKLSRLMCDLMALPHFSASVERVFSQLNVIKTKQAHRLRTGTVANRLLAKQSITRQGVPCYK